MFNDHSTWNLAIAGFLCAASALHLSLDSNPYGLTTFQLSEIIPRLSQRGLTERDVCTDAIPGTVSQTCSPGNTLCCVPNNTEIAFPQCQVLFGEGFCCVEEGGACYQDTQSDCSAVGAVECTELAPGTSEACCPQFTQCPGNFNQSNEDVRCQFTPSASSSSSSASSSSTTTSTSIIISSTTSASASTTSSTEPSITSPTSTQSIVLQTPTLDPESSGNTSSSSSLSAGADAGIGVAAASIILCLAAIGIWLYRRGKKRGALAAGGTGANNFPPSPYHDAVENGNVHPWQPLSNHNYPHGFYGKHELSSEGRHELPVENDHELRELPAGHNAHELNNESLSDGR